MINTVVIAGNLTKDPELRTTQQTGKSVCSFTIAVNDGYGEQQKTYFLPVVTWNAQADSCAKSLRKGSKVCVTGAITTRSYEDKDGQKRTVTEIVGRGVEFLTPRQDAQREPGEEYPAPAPSAPASRPPLEEIDEDLPF